MPGDRRVHDELIDNCEHFVAAVSRLVRDLLRACPNLRVLCTSRECLGITGEVVRAVRGLALPSLGKLDAVGDCTCRRAERSVSVLTYSGTSGAMPYKLRRSVLST